MPCQCDYAEPNQREIESRVVAKLLIYVNTCLGLDSSEALKEATKNPYGNTREVDNFTAQLCGYIENFTPEQINTIVYDGRNPGARALADWWDRHQEHDRIREQQISEKEKQRKHDQLFSKFKSLSIEEMEKAIQSVTE